MLEISVWEQRGIALCPAVSLFFSIVLERRRTIRISVIDRAMFFSSVCKQHELSFSMNVN